MPGRNPIQPIHQHRCRSIMLAVSLLAFKQEVFHRILIHRKQSRLVRQVLRFNPESARQKLFVPAHIHIHNKKHRPIHSRNQTAPSIPMQRILFHPLENRLVIRRQPFSIDIVSSAESLQIYALCGPAITAHAVYDGFLACRARGHCPEPVSPKTKSETQRRRIPFPPGVRFQTSAKPA